MVAPHWLRYSAANSARARGAWWQQIAGTLPAVRQGALCTHVASYKMAIRAQLQGHWLRQDVVQWLVTSRTAAIGAWPTGAQWSKTVGRLPALRQEAAAPNVSSYISAMSPPQLGAQ